MKKVIFALTFLVASFTLYAQNESFVNEKRTKYGINIGINYSNVTSKNLPIDGEISNGLGFQLGILADYKISNAMSISPKTEIAFNGGQVIFTDPNSPDINYSVMPVIVGLGVHLNYKINQGGLNPYFYVGSSIHYPIADDPSTDLIYPTKTNLVLDIGIGLEKITPHFNFAPELRYSLGLRDISEDTSFGALRGHTLSFIINFAG